MTCLIISPPLDRRGSQKANKLENLWGEGKSSSAGWGSKHGKMGLGMKIGLGMHGCVLRYMCPECTVVL